jgi:hypothetical protein
VKVAVGIVALVLVPVLVIATSRAGRREPSPPDPACWRREVAEPWGTIVLLVFFLAPPITVLGGLIGAEVAALPLIAGLLVLALAVTRPFSAIRRVCVGEDALEVRAGLRRASFPLADVLSVTNLLDDERAPEVHLASGGSILLAEDEHARAVATLLAARIGQTWGIPDPHP